MEYVGSQVKKVVQGGVTLFGFIQAYLACTGFYKILYDNGESEELSFPEMSSLLVSPQPPCPKRRRLNIQGTDGGAYLRDGGDVLGFDLNEGTNWVLNEGIGEGSSGMVGRGLIDLNVDINQGLENVGGEREIRNFDLNVKLIEDEQVGDFDDHLSTPAVGASSTSRGNSDEVIVHPPKVELPRSCSLNIEGVSVFDVLSVYVFLRSFSTLLFLSPFELDDFLACILCTDSTLLFDHIHVSLLRTLTTHLKWGSKFADRYLNWDLLDLITWPIFLVEYLLLKSPGHIDVCHLETLQSDYYKLPVSAKIQILQQLCDDVVETETFMSELDSRSSPRKQHIQSSSNVKLQSSKRRKSILDIASPSCVREEDSNEPSDWNGEDCYLCKMDGNLICCDGCPKAFHTRCVGVVSSQLPEGEWYCPECSIDRNNPQSQVRKSVRGAELLGIDPHGRLYYNSFDFLLVLESCHDKYSSWCYKKKDLPTLIEALNSSPFLYDTIIGAICKQWDVNTGVNMSSTTLKVEQGNSINSKNYVNFYEYARTPSLVEESTLEVSDKTSEDAPRSKRGIILRQAKVVLNRFAEFSWSNIQNSNVKSRKEKCGWCFYCKNRENDGDCLFVMNDVFPVIENFTNEVLGIDSRNNRKNHLTDVICHIICIEDHLSGLLVGPWLNPGYSQLWRQGVLGVSDLASIKNLVLEVESNLHHLALSPDWRKHVDSDNTVGSACHIVSSAKRQSSKHGKRALFSNNATGLQKLVDPTSCCNIESSPSEVSSKHGTRRKKSKPSKLEIDPSLDAVPPLSLVWWRGGRVSRRLFNFKVLPRSLAFKAGRQGGCKKISGVYYPGSGEYAKRMKYTAWRAAVETSRCVEQLALQVRELDAAIKWDDIGNNNLLSKTDTKSKKFVNSFKKARICKKSSDGLAATYLLDFGRRGTIPNIVKKHGSRLEDSSNGRKKYWLEESYVPLYLLKAFEKKRITCKNCSEELPVSCNAMRKVIKKKGFEYLFSRAEKLENYQCGSCKKDVPISEAVSCLYCSGFFHKRHARKSAESITAGYTYTCHKCEEMATLQIRSVKKQKYKKVAKSKSQLKNWVLVKKRTPRDKRYWLNGFKLTIRTNDKRAINFRRKMLIVFSGEEPPFNSKPTCSLCDELEYSPDVSYLACELCGVWYHGDALGLTDDKFENLIGFRCHKCVDKKPPFCPHSSPTGKPRQDDMAADKKSRLNNVYKNILMSSRKQKCKDIVEIDYFVLSVTWCIWKERNCWVSVTNIILV